MPSWARRRRWRGRKRSSSSAAAKGALFRFCIPDDWRRRFCGQAIPETLELWGMTLGKGYFQEACALSPLWYSYKDPVLILHGDEDKIVALSYSEKAAKKYHRAELEVFAGEGHGFSEAGMHRVEGMALSFVRRVLAGR